MSKVTIIIPSRNEKYTARTVEDLLEKATGEIEIYVILDGWWLKTDEYNSDPRVNYIHYSTPRGMRNAINSGVALSRGEYLLKTDAHCMFDKGFDEKLKADHQDNWIQIPRRYPLDVEKWQIEEREDDKYPIDVMKLDENLQGRHTRERKDNALIETESFQGSCWFMKKDYYHELDLMDEERFGGFWQEAQEMGLKCQKNGGKVMRNTKTWYAHWHKTGGRGYSLSEDQMKVRDEIKKLKEEPIMYAHEEDGTVTPIHAKQVTNTFKVEEKKPMITDRIELAKHFKNKGFLYGAEVGVADGRYSQILCEEIPGLQLYCIDPYMKYDGNWRSNDYQQKAFEKAQERLSTHNAQFMRTTGVEASLKIMDESLDFVFIDGAHDFDNVLLDIILWSKKVRKGGIVAGHDYYQFDSGGVIEAVNAYVQAHKIDLNLTLRGVAEHKDDQCPCWWFEKK